MQYVPHHLTCSPQGEDLVVTVEAAGQVPSLLLHISSSSFSFSLHFSIAEARRLTSQGQRGVRISRLGLL